MGPFRGFFLEKVQNSGFFKNYFRFCLEYSESLCYNNQDNLQILQEEDKHESEIIQ